MKIKDVRDAQHEMDLGQIGRAEIVPGRNLLEVQCLRGYSVYLTEQEALDIVLAWQTEYPVTSRKG